MSPDTAQTHPPTVGGRRTFLHHLPTIELAHSPLLTPLVSLSNAAFASSHKPPWFAPMKPMENAQVLARLTPTTTVWYLTHDEDVSTAESASTILAAIMEEPYVPPPEGDPDTDLAAAVKPRLPEDGPDVEDRRLVRFFVVDPAFHGQGIGSWLLRFLEDQMLQRARQSRLEPGGKPVSALHLVLSTVEEINGAFYLRQGWRVTRKSARPADCMGSLSGYTLVWMDKILPLDN